MSFTDTHTLSATEALESLSEFERNKPEIIKRARSTSRIRIRSKVIAQPGNSGDRLKSEVQGITGVVSAGGCQILFPITIGVGDFYWLTFDKNDLDIDTVLGRCLRCRLIRENAYEAGFKFFNPIDLSSAVESNETENNNVESNNTEALFD
jgi:hypothetical protein